MFLLAVTDKKALVSERLIAIGTGIWLQAKAK